MDLQKLQALYTSKYNAALAKAKEWEGKEDEMPKTASDEIDALLGECDEILVKIKTAKNLEKAGQTAQQSAGLQAAHLGWRDAGPGEGLQPVDPQSWRETSFKTFQRDPMYGIVHEVERKFRYHVPLTVQHKDYPVAFESYMRKGQHEMGPNDRKTLNEGTDSAGGFTVPEDYMVELIRKMATLATFRANARVAQTSRDIAKWPKIHYTTDDEYTSGVRLTWTGESPASATTHRVTDPVFGLYSIPVHTAMASLPLTNDLIEDSAFDVMGISGDLLAEAFALGENDAFWNGSGVARPMGVLAQVDGDGPASVVSGDANLVTSDGLIDLAYALPAQYERNAKFFFNKTTEREIRQLRYGAGLEYIWPYTLGASGGFSPNNRELLGYPTLRDEFLPNIAANAFPIVFGDLTGYLVLDRVGFSLQRLSELYAETNITLLLARKRVGGQTIQPWRIKVQKISA